LGDVCVGTLLGHPVTLSWPAYLVVTAGCEARSRRCPRRAVLSGADRFELGENLVEGGLENDSRLV